jgi:hypothetical protein
MDAAATPAVAGTKLIDGTFDLEISEDGCDLKLIDADVLGNVTHHYFDPDVAEVLADGLYRGAALIRARQSLA